MFIQQLNEADYEKHEKIVEQLMQLLEENNNLMFMSDEAHFHLSGEVTSKTLAQLNRV